jgi:hypothetical protein
LIHRLTYNRRNHDNIHVRGFNEEGTTTTPFDMVVLNGLDRFHLAIDVIERVPGLGSRAAHAKQRFRDKLIEHRRYVDEKGEICRKSRAGAGLTRPPLRQAIEWKNPRPALCADSQAIVAAVPRIIAKDACNDNCYDFGFRGMTE